MGEDNLHAFEIIPLFLHDVSLNSCLRQIGFVIVLITRLPLSPPFAPSSFTQTLIIVSICPLTTQLFPVPRSHAPAPMVLPYQRGVTRWVCSANLNHTGRAHLWKQMSTGAGVLFLFRWSVCVWLRATRPPPLHASVLRFSQVCMELVWVQNIQTGRCHSGIRRGTGNPSPQALITSPAQRR